MLSREEPKIVIIKKGEKMERYGKKQWKDEGEKKTVACKRGSRLAKNGSGSQARTLVNLSPRTGNFN